MLQMVKKNLGPYNSGYHKWICCTYSSLYSVGFYKYNKVEQLTKFLRMSFCSHQRTDDFSCLGSFENMPPILFLVGWEGVRSFLKPFFFERRCSEVEICFVQKWEYTGCSIIRGTHVDGIFYIENWKILPRNIIRILKVLKMWKKFENHSCDFQYEMNNSFKYTFFSRPKQKK